MGLRPKRPDDVTHGVARGRGDRVGRQLSLRPTRGVPYASDPGQGAARDALRGRGDGLDELCARYAADLQPRGGIQRCARVSPAPHTEAGRAHDVVPRGGQGDRRGANPFAGSGTTGVAALRLGRRVILIEKDPKDAALCVERMRAEELGQSLEAMRAGQLTLLGGKPLPRCHRRPPRAGLASLARAAEPPLSSENCTWTC